MASSYPNKFGPRNGINSKDYLLHMQPPDGYATDRPVSLLGHGLTAPNQNLTDALTFIDVELRNGRVVTVSRVARSAQETSRTYTIGIPSTLWTPVMEVSYKQGCTSTFFLIYLCPEDDIYNHFDALPEATLNPAVEAEEIITTGEDTNVISFTSEMQVPQKVRGWALGYDILYTSAIAGAGFDDVVFVSQNCAGCGDRVGFEFITVGGDKTATPVAPAIFLSTTDRFGSTSGLTTSATVGRYGTALYTDGDLVIAAFNDDYDTPTGGELWVSIDGGANFTQVASFTDRIKDIYAAGDVIVLVGSDGTDGVIHISTDQGQSFTAIVDTNLTTNPLTAGAYDKETGRLYFVGDGGVFFSGRLSGSTLRLSDLSANLSGAPGNLLAIAVLGKNEILLGGAAGYLTQSRDGGLAFSGITLGTASAVSAIAGNQMRTMVGAGSALYRRDPLNMNSFAVHALEAGATVTGNYTRIRMGLESNFNYFVASTDASEVVFGKPYYPNA